MRTATLPLALAIVLTSACASYPERLSEALENFEAGDFEPAFVFMADEVDSPFLSGAEAGTVALTAGEWDLARELFERAEIAAKDLEDRAVLGAEPLAEAVSSWVINDRTRTYQGEGFERVYVHTSLALTYLAEGRLSDVFVETRRANLLLEAEERLYETTYRAGGWGHLLSAIVYELLGELDHAYIDYNRMVEKDVGTAIAGPALVRLAGRLGRTDDLARWQERFGAARELPEGAASVIVLAGVGLGPLKVEGSLTVPLPSGVYRMAVPDYERRPQLVSALRLVDQETGVGARTELIEDVAEVARKNLADRVGWIAARSAARGALKLALTKQLEDEYGAAGWIAGSLYTIFTERADLRAWMTLPDSWQACRLFVPPGERTLILDAVGGELVRLGAFRLDPGETMFVFVRTLGQQAHVHVVGGVPIATTENEVGSP